MTEDQAGTGKSAGRSWLDRLGIYPPLVWGYVGLLLFMIGDGVEAGYLAPYLQSLGNPSESVAWVITVYGITAAVAAWLSGALSDLWGPRRVMWLGLLIWAAFEVALLRFGVGARSYRGIMAFYAIRGFGYPLFAYGFLVWLTTITPRARLGTAVGWFWFAFTGGLLFLGPQCARYALPRFGELNTLWLSLGLVIVGGLIALFGMRDPTGDRRLAPPGEDPVRTLLLSVRIAWQNPKTTVGCLVRVINTAAQFGFLVFMPDFLTKTVGFTREQWLDLLSLMFLSNIVWNLLFGIIGDRFGWRNTVAYCGGLGCTVTTLLLYFIPVQAGPNFALVGLAVVLYGATLAGYVPLSALMPSLAPENKAASMSLLNLGAGASMGVGPLVVALFLRPLGVSGVMFIFAGMYLVSAVLALFLTLPPARPDMVPGEVRP